MAPRNRSNPLALAVLISLYERPMHPYEVATTLRQRNKHESVRLNYGSLYAVVDSLERRGLIEPQETARAGRLPERTVYALTEAGRVETHDWLTDLIATPTKEYPAFEAALSFLPALPPADVVGLLLERAERLEFELAQAEAAQELVQKHGLPRLFWVEDEFRTLLRRAELDYVRRLAREIDTGALEGVDWWTAIHENRGVPDHPWGFHHDEHANAHPRTAHPPSGHTHSADSSTGADEGRTNRGVHP
jgi:DNA-binding PadR family transcriptional regulator